MSTFDFNEYLRNREAGKGATASKAEQILQARQAKGQALVDRIQEVGTKLVDLDADSWVKKLDFHPDTIGAGVVNTAANLVSGASRTLGDIGSAAFDLNSIYQDSKLSQPAVEAYNRATAGTATAADLALLQTPDRDGVTPINRLAGSNKSRKTAADIDSAMDLGKIVYGADKRALAKDLEQGFEQPFQQLEDGYLNAKEGAILSGSKDMVAGAAKLVLNAGSAAINNKMGVVGYVAENIPQLALNAVPYVGTGLMAASNVGYGAENYRKGIEKYQKENKGALPPEETRTYMAQMAAAAAAADQLGQLGQLKAMGSFGKAGKAAGTAAEAAAEAEKAVARTTLKQALFNTGKGTAIAAGEEAATEGFQTYAEGEAQLTPASAKDIYVGAAIGGMSGGTISGAARGVAEAAELIGQPGAGPAKGKEAAPKVDFQKAAAENNFAAYLDDTTTNYDPSKAVGVLFKNSTLPEVTIDQQASNLVEANKVFEDYGNKIDETFALIPQGKKQLTEELQEAKARLAGLDPQDAANAPKIERVTAEVGRLQGLVDLPLAEGKAAVEAATQHDEMRKKEAVLVEQLMAFSAENKLRKKNAPSTPAVVEPALVDPVDPATGVPVPAASVVEAAPGAAPVEAVPVDPTATAVPATPIEAAPVQLAPEEELKQNLVAATSPVAPDDTAGLEASTAAAKKVLILSMEAPDSISQKDALALANNKSNGLSEQERSYLRLLSAAQLAKTKLMNTKGVTQEVMLGNAEKKQKGIATYTETVTSALELGNERIASQALKGLSNFNESHQNKAVAVLTALKNARNEGNTDGYEVVRLADSNKWEIREPSLTPAQLKKVGGLRVHMGSGDVVSAVQVEAKALATSLASLSEATALRFNPQAVKPLVAPATATTEAASVTAEAPAMAATEVAAAPVAAETAPTELVTISDGYRDLSTGGQASSSIPPGEALPEEAGTFASAELAQSNSKTTAEQPTADQSTALNDQSPAATETTSAVQSSVDVRSSEQIAAVKPTSADTPTAVVNEPENETSQQEEATATEAENTVEPEQEEETEDAAQAGQLDAFKNGEAERAKPYQQRNAVAAGWMQRLRGNNKAQATPLVAIKNLASNLRNGSIDLAQAFGKELAARLASSPTEMGAYTKFLEKAKNWDARITADLVKKTVSATAKSKAEDYYFQDMLQFLMQSVDMNGKTVQQLEENLRTAMSYAGFSWVAENATRSEFNDDAQINKILNKEAKKEVSLEAKRTLATVGMRETALHSTLGARALQALGMEFRKDAPQGDKGRLEAVIGARILKVLMTPDDAAGTPAILVRSTVSNAVMQNLMRDEPIGTERETKPKDEMTAEEIEEEKKLFKLTQQGHNFVSFTRAKATKKGGFERRELTAETKEILEAVKGSRGILDRLFIGQQLITEPSFFPVKFAQKLARKTRRAIPSKLAKIVQKENDLEWKVRADTFGFIAGLPTDLQHALIGAEDPDEFTHVDNAPGLAAKADALRNDLSKFIEYVSDAVVTSEKGLDQELFFEHTVMRQQRVHITTKLINPQASKVHRWMLYQPAWETKVDPNNESEMENFKLRVMEGLGIKTEKSLNKENLAQFASLFSRAAVLPGPKQAEQMAKAKVLNLAVAALMKQLNNQELSLEEQQQIIAGVKQGGEKLHSLDALMAVAEWKRSNGAPFTVRLMGEIDGVTNGPMLSHLLMGAGHTVVHLQEFLNRGGFFEKGSDHKHYSDYRSTKGNEDLYESTMGKVLAHLPTLIEESLYPDKTRETIQAITAFTGKLITEDNKVTSSGRKFIKTPLTGYVFGAASYKAAQNMADAFIGDIYSAFEKAARNKEDVRPLIEQLNVLTGYAHSWDVNMSASEVLSTSLNKNQVEAIRKNFYFSFGKAVKETLEETFAVFEQRRDAMNTAAKAAFNLYNAVYSVLREEEIAKLVKSGEIAADKTGKPLHDLTQEQEKAVQERLISAEPILHTLMSRDSGNREAGITVSKGSRKISEDPTYGNRATFATPIPNVDPNAKENYSTEVSGMESVDLDPGVAMTIFGTHSSDSAISHFAAGLGKILNVHDAHGDGLANFMQTGKNLNAATWDVMLRYSPLTEMAKTLELIMLTLGNVMKDKPMSPEVAERFMKGMFGPENDFDADKMPFILERLLTSIQQEAKEADITRLSLLAQLGYIDQYAIEGGQYEVTEADTNKAVALWQERESKPASSVESVSYATRLGQLFAGKTADVIINNKRIEDFTLAELSGEYKQPSKNEAAKMRSTKASLAALEVIANDEKRSSEEREKARVAIDLYTAGETKIVEAAVKIAEGDKKVFLQTSVAEIAKKVPSHFWTENGESNTPSERSLVEFFIANPKPTITEFARAVFKALREKEQTPYVQFQIQLLNSFHASSFDNLEVKYITAANVATEMKDAPLTKSRGWYAANGNEQAIYFLSPEFQHSGLTTETAVHEMVHVAVARVIANELAKRAENKDYNSSALELIDDLQRLKDKASAETTPELRKEFAAAFRDIQEFVAWGMTNEAFQDKVIKNVTMVSKTKKNVLVKGMESFIRALTGLFFGSTDKSRQAIAVNGMSILVSNVSGLVLANSKNKTFASVLLSQESTDPLTSVYKLSTGQIFNSLEALAGSRDVGYYFKEHLATLQVQISNKLNSMFGLIQLPYQANQTTTSMDVWQKTLDSGEMPFASKVAAAPFATTPQELFVIEQMEVAMRTALENPEAPVGVAYKELVRIYQEVRAKVKPSDFANQAQYDFLFKVDQSTDKKSEYLSRFMAMGLAHKDVYNVLYATELGKSITSTDPSWVERLGSVLKSVLDWLYQKITQVPSGQKTPVAMQRLLEQMVNIEAKRRTALAKENSSVSKFAGFENKATDFVDAVKMKALDLATSDFVKKTKSGYVKGVAGISQIVINDQTEAVLASIQQLRDRHLKQTNAWVTGLLNEVRGVPNVVQALIRMAKKNEQDRKRHIDDVAKVTRSAFKMNGQELTELEDASITRVFMRTGMHVLTDTRSLADIQGLLEDPAKLNGAIKEQIGNLSEHASLVHYYVFQAKALGYFKATGQVKSKMLMMNANNIARLYGTGKNVTLSEAQLEEATQAIDQLASLYALKYTDDNSMTAAKEVLRSEMNRPDGGNGVEQVLKLHKQLEKDAEDRIFKGSKALMMKGFTSEIVNPHTSIAVARNGVEKRILLEKGYSEGAEVFLDDDDPNREKGRIFVLEDGGLLPRVTGAVSLTGEASKGSLSSANASGTFMTEYEADAQIAQNITSARQRDLARLFQPNAGWDPSKDMKKFMAPIMNSKGEVSGWRYLMEDDTRDNLLKRDNRFDQVLGAIAGSLVDKESTPKQNEDVLLALKEIFNQDYAKRPESFVRISAQSADPELREIYRLLPDSTQKMLKDIWGKDGLMVPYELLHPVFGYRKWSLSSAFDKKSRNDLAIAEGRSIAQGDDLSTMEELFTAWVEKTLYHIGRAKGMDEKKATTYSRRGGVLVRRAENYWQTLVQLTKDIIVVKTGSVLFSNISENIGMLILQGVSPKTIVQDHLIAIRGAMDYQSSRRQLAEIQIKLNSGYTRGDEDELRSQAAILEDAIARNPVTELVEAGLMPTIAEDLSQEEDIYSYKSKFQRGVDNLTSKVNPQILEMGKWAFMTHDTPLYKGLSQVNQLSDFVGRYVLYKHLTSRKNNPLSKEDAVQKASDVFVNYDIAMHPGMQYLDDHGFMMFTKYFLRIQKVLLRLTRDNPLRVLLGVALHNQFSSLPMPMNSSMLARVGNNPFSDGALKFPGTVDETLPIQGLKMLF